MLGFVFLLGAIFETTYGGQFQYFNPGFPQPPFYQQPIIQPAFYQSHPQTYIHQRVQPQSFIHPQPFIQPQFYSHVPIPQYQQVYYQPPSTSYIYHNQGPQLELKPTINKTKVEIDIKSDSQDQNEMTMAQNIENNQKFEPVQKIEPAQNFEPAPQLPNQIDQNQINQIFNPQTFRGFGYHTNYEDGATSTVVFFNGPRGPISGAKEDKESITVASDSLDPQAKNIGELINDSAESRSTKTSSAGSLTLSPIVQSFLANPKPLNNFVQYFSDPVYPANTVALGRSFNIIPRAGIEESSTTTESSSTTIENLKTEEEPAESIVSSSRLSPNIVSEEQKSSTSTTTSTTTETPETSSVSTENSASSTVTSTTEQGTPSTSEQGTSSTSEQETSSTSQNVAETTENSTTTSE